MNAVENHVPLLPPAAMLTAGIMAARWISWPILYWLIALSTTVCLALLCFRRRSLCSLSILLAVFALGAFLSERAERGLYTTLPKEKVAYEGVLMSEPVSKGKVIRFDLAIINDEKPIIAKAALLRDTIQHHYQRLHIGDGIRAESYLEEPMNFASSDFDYERWLRLHGFTAETFILPDDWQKDRVTLKPLGRWNRALIRMRQLRQKLVSQLLWADGLKGDAAAIVVAMTLGDKSLLSSSVKDDYNRAGAAHMLALSGLHLGILCSVFSLLGKRRRRRKWLPTLLGVSTAWGFALLTGLSPSVIRAALMCSIYGGIGLLGREQQPVNTLMATLIIMLIAQPLMVYDLAFQLSVLAVWSIQLFYPILKATVPQKEWMRRWRIVGWTGDILAVSLAAQIGTAPLIAYTFNRFSTYFLLTNLIAVPCATLVIYLAFLLLVVSPLAWVRGWVGIGLAWAAQTMNTALRWVAHLPGSTVEELHPSTTQTVLFYIFILILWLFIKRLQLAVYKAQRRNIL